MAPIGSVEPRKLAQLAVVGALLMLATAAWRIASSPVNGVTMPQIKAEPYIWYGQCERRDYRLFDRINRACATDKYLFRLQRQYHLRPDHSSPYYRVGDDLVQINCGFYKTCSISNIYRHAYGR